LKLNIQTLMSCVKVIIRLLEWHEINKQKSTSIFLSLILCRNEELTGLLGEQKHEWKESGLTQKQIQKREFLLIIELYRERIVCWTGWDRIQVRIGIK
jgi:hypothetical protein